MDGWDLPDKLANVTLTTPRPHHQQMAPIAQVPYLTQLQLSIADL